MNEEVGILSLSYGNYISLDDYMKLQNNWNELKKWLKYKDEHTIQQNNYYSVLNKMQELEQGKDE